MRPATILGLGALDIVQMDATKNCGQIWQLAEEAHQAGVELLVLPELSNLGQVPPWTAGAAREYFERCAGTQDMFLSELCRCAREINICIIAGFAEVHPALSGTVCNSAMFITPDMGVAGIQRKLHLPLIERDYFFPGDGLTLFQTEFGNIACLICYDLYFPELAYSLTQAGAELLCGIANIPSRPQWPDRIAQIASVRSYENMQYVAVVNRAGGQFEHTYNAERVIAEPPGHFIAVSGEEQEGIVKATLTAEALTDSRLRRSIISDRRSHREVRINNVRAR